MFTELGKVLAKVSTTGGCISGAGIATAISFVPFRSEIAYNVEIKRPREPPARHESSRNHEGKRRWPGRGEGNMEIYQPPGTRNSISVYSSRHTLNATRGLVSCSIARFNRFEIRWTRFEVPWMMALLIGRLLDLIKERFFLFWRFKTRGIFISFFLLFEGIIRDEDPPSKEWKKCLNSSRRS